MYRKTILATITITILAASASISNLAYAHIDICAGSDNGKPFNELWVAICDLQSQIDAFENKHNGQLVNVGIKRVQLNDGTCPPVTDPTHPISVGWCPSGGNNQFLISDPALTDKSVVSIATLSPPGSNNISVHCSVESINFIQDLNSGFLVVCDHTPVQGTVLNYVIFFDFSPIHVETTNNPTGIDTNSNHDDDNKKSKSHDDDNKKSKSHDDDDKKSKSYDDDRK